MTTHPSRWSRIPPEGGARWVDDQLAPPDRRAGRSSPTASSPKPPPSSTPETTNAARSTPQAERDVDLSHPDPGDFTGRSTLTADGDTLTLQSSTTWSARSPTSCSSTATPAPLGRAEDQGPPGHHPPAPGQGTLETHRQQPANGPARCKVYVHLEAADLDHDARSRHRREARCRHRDPDPAVGRPPPGRHPTGAEPAARDAVDQHDPPPWMRELVILRDGHCIFPGCTRDASSCDLDHTIPYDPDGPPGQTIPDNLAPVQETPPRQDRRRVALLPHARRPLPLARPPPRDVPGHRPRHHPTTLTIGMTAQNAARARRPPGAASLTGCVRCPSPVVVALLAWEVDHVVMTSSPRPPHVGGRPDPMAGAQRSVESPLPPAGTCWTTRGPRRASDSSGWPSCSTV